MALAEANGMDVTHLYVIDINAFGIVCLSQKRDLVGLGGMGQWDDDFFPVL